MKQTNWDGKEVLLVEVPEGVNSLSVNGCYIELQFLPEVEADPLANYYLENKLPPGDWQFAFASPLYPTEIEAGEWVEKESRIEVVDHDAGGGGRITITSCKDYEALENGYEYDLDTIESLHSRIKSEGFPHPERVVLLTKK